MSGLINTTRSHRAAGSHYFRSSANYHVLGVCPNQFRGATHGRLFIVDVHVNEPVEYEEYRKLTTPTLAPFGGKFIVRGGSVETLEGDWKPGRLVILEFPSIEQGKAWYASPDYVAAKAIRLRTASTNMILVQGV